METGGKRGGNGARDTHSSAGSGGASFARIESKVIVRSRFDSGRSTSSCAGSVGRRSCVYSSRKSSSS